MNEVNLRPGAQLGPRMKPGFIFSSTLGLGLLFPMEPSLPRVCDQMQGSARVGAEIQVFLSPRQGGSQLSTCQRFASQNLMVITCPQGGNGCHCGAEGNIRSPPRGRKS